mgnify:CR=1 FL=1
MSDFFINREEKPLQEQKELFMKELEEKNWKKENKMLLEEQKEMFLKLLIYEFYAEQYI